MKKWQKVTIWVASILIVLVVGGLFAANYAVDKVLDSMVGMSVDDLLEESITPDEVDTIIPDESEEQTDGNSASDLPDSTEQQGNSNDGGQESTSTDSTEKPNATTKPEASKTPEATKKPEGNKSESGYSAEISTDKAKEVQDNISVSEKAKVVTTLMGSLSASDISTLQKLASGGLSVEEKKQAKEIMLEKLSEDQYNELIAIAAKHGLSQGKKYSETKAE